MVKREKLEKTLKPHWVWAIALGASIGWGAFVQPINWMEEAGPLGVIIGFFIGAALMMLIAVSYGFLIKSFPVSGGEFAYAFISLGRTHAFISGWFLTLGYICIVALNASAFSLMIKYVFPSFIEVFPLYTIAGWDVYGMEIIVATIGLAFFGYLNIKGTGLTGQIQFIFAVTMVVSVIALAFSVGIQPEAGFERMTPVYPTGQTAIASILAIVAISPWAFVGFDAVPQAAEEFDFPARKAFMLIVLALFFAAVLYSLMIMATSMGSSWQEVAAENPLWGTGQVIGDLLGPLGLLILVISLSMGIFTGLNGFILASSRLLFAMARAKILPESFGKVHKKHNTPYVAVLFIVIVSMIAPWFGREALTWVVDMSSVGVSIAYFYTCITAYQLFKWKKGDVEDPSTEEAAPFKKFIALFGSVASLVFIALLLAPSSPAFLGSESLVSLVVWVFLGVAFYLYKRKEYLSIPEEELHFLIIGKRMR